MGTTAVSLFTAVHDRFPFIINTKYEEDVNVVYCQHTFNLILLFICVITFVRLFTYLFIHSFIYLFFLNFFIPFSFIYLFSLLFSLFIYSIIYLFVLS